MNIVHIEGRVRLPYAAPSTEAFSEISPLGERQGCRLFSEGLGSPFRKPSEKALARRIKAVFGSLFLWILSFGDAKESISAVGPRTDIKISVAVATPFSKIRVLRQ
ncbi:hypothetical protein [Methylomonas sp. WH-1]|uniref:hypothetical protein n=1 Tax=Methylomonas sp. WH-1 TaxID=2815719 RepID=UPI00051BB411